MDQHVRPKRKPGTVREYQLLIDKHISPAIGKYKAIDVTRPQVAELHRSMRETPFAANRALGFLSAAFNWAERQGLRPDNSNPCRHVERYREQARERFLSSAELARLGEVLTELESAQLAPPAAIAAIRLLIVTGMRKGEVLGLRWEYVDWERKCVRLPDSKSGAKSVPLNAPAIQVLSSLMERRGDSPWVVQGARQGQPFVGLQRIWRRALERAALDGVRLHDLRHTHAAVLAGSGVSLPIIGRILGHSIPATTARYAHLSDDPVREASDEAGRQIAAAMSGGKGADIVPIRGAK